MRIRAAGTAASASGQPSGRATANASTTASSNSASVRLNGGTASLPRVFAPPHRGQVHRDTVLGGQLVEDADGDVQVVAGIGQGPQRFGQRAEEVVPVNEDHPAGAHSAHGLGPVVDHV